MNVAFKVLIRNRDPIEVNLPQEEILVTTNAQGDFMLCKGANGPAIVVEPRSVVEAIPVVFVSRRDFVGLETWPIVENNE